MMTPLTDLAVRFQVATDSLRTSGNTTAYDSIWGGAIPEQSPSALERIMLSHDKIYVVLAVVLLIWIGISIFLLRTDRKLASLERTVAERIPEDDDML
jgi:hypothetical protein